MSKQKQVVLVAGMLLLGFVGAHAQETIKLGKFEAGPQIAMLINRTQADGTKVAFIQEVVPVVVLKDAEEQHSAPRSPGTHLICRGLYEYHKADGEPALAFSCGSDIYTVSDISFIPKKDSKKYTGE